MTQERAIEVLEIMKSQLKDFGMTSEFNGVMEMQKSAIDISVKSLKEIQRYRAIGTVEECREARERQREKKPYIQSDGHGETELDCYECPNCDSFLGYVSDCKDEQYQDSYC